MFDKIFYINLKHRTDRKKFILKEFDRIGFPRDKIQQIEGVDTPHLGCNKAHILTLITLLNTKGETFFIAEDDLCFIMDKEVLNDKLNYFFNNYPDFDVLLIQCNMMERPNLLEKGICRINDAICLGGYVLRKRYAAKLLDLWENKTIEAEKHLEEAKKLDTSFLLDQVMRKLQKVDRWYSFIPEMACQKEDKYSPEWVYRLFCAGLIKNVNDSEKYYVSSRAFKGLIETKKRLGKKVKNYNII